MANLAASKKNIRKINRQTVVNDRLKRRYRDAIKSVKVALSANDLKVAGDLLPKAYQLLDKAAKGGVIRKQTASRLKSRVTKHLNRLTAADVEATDDAN